MAIRNHCHSGVTIPAVTVRPTARMAGRSEGEHPIGRGMVSGLTDAWGKIGMLAEYSGVQWETFVQERELRRHGSYSVSVRRWLP